MTLIAREEFLGKQKIRTLAIRWICRDVSCTHAGFVGDPALLVVAGVALPLLGGPVVRDEGGVALLAQLVLTDDLVLPHGLGNLNTQTRTFRPSLFNSQANSSDQALQN